MKKFDIKKYWYLIPLVVSLIIFSASCWFHFITAYQDRAESTPLAEPSESAGDNAFSALADSTDRHVEQADTIWKENVTEKKALSNVDSLYSYSTTQYVSSTQVLLGKQDWLFYKTTSDGDPIADYEGTNLYDDETLDYISGQVLNTQTEIEDRGITFTLFLPPNKENVYSELMPDTYTAGKENRADILIENMQKMGVHAVSPKAALLQEHENQDLYYAYDTHWNQLGGYIGVKDILADWGIEIPALSERSIDAFLLEDKYPQHHTGAADDLADMAGLDFLRSKEMEYEIEGTPEMDWGQYALDEEAKALSHYTNDDAMLDATIFLVGDSFRTAMIPALREVFSEVYVSHRYNYDISMLDEIDPDYMIMEYVERYTDEIAGIHYLVEDEEE